VIRLFSEDKEASIVHLVPKCLLPSITLISTYCYKITHMTQPTNERNLGPVLPCYPVTHLLQEKATFSGRHIENDI
jgi:hypothetical protein